MSGVVKVAIHSHSTTTEFTMVEEGVRAEPS